MDNFDFDNLIKSTESKLNELEKDLVLSKKKTAVEMSNDDIVNYLKIHSDKVGIIQTTINDPLYSDKSDLSKKYLVDDHIEILNSDSNFIELVCDNISKSIIKLEIPYDILKHLDLSEFKNLKSLKVTSGSITITNELLNYFKNKTNIEEIEANYVLDSNIKENVTMLKGLSPVILYKDKIVKHRGFSSSGSLNVYNKNPYENIEDIMKLIELYAKKPIHDINVQDDLNDNSKTMIEYKNDKSLKNAKEDNNSYILKLDKVNVIDDIFKVIEAFEKRNLPIDGLSIKLYNKSYENIEQMRKLYDKYSVNLTYEGAYDVDVSLDDFISMRYTLDYYKGIIQESNLSDFEKLIYAYDLIKSFEYDEVDLKKGENPLDSRLIHNIVRSGKIVCAGYSKFLSQLLKEMNIESYTIYVSSSGLVDDHERNMIKLNDDKYGINGVYALDATADSAKNLIEVVDAEGNSAYRIGKENVKEKDKIVRYHDNFSNYRHFMISGIDYTTVFENEKIPNYSNVDIYFGKEEIQYGDRKNANLSKKFSMDFDSFLHSEEIPQEVFLEAVKNVRMAEGCNLDNLNDSLESVITVNRLNQNLLSNQR